MKTIQKRNCYTKVEIFFEKKILLFFYVGKRIKIDEMDCHLTDSIV